MRTYLERHARDAAESMGVGAHASITFRHYGTTVRAGSSSARSRRCDDAEVRVQAGPCISAMLGMAPVVLPDLRGESRWPEWQERFRSEDFASFLAIPVAVGARTEIALNVYAGPRAWTPADLATAARAAGAVALDVRARLRLAAGVVDERPDGPRRGERDRLDLAVGVLMQARGCDAATAERAVHALALRSGTDLAGLARLLVAAAVLPRRRWDGRTDGAVRG
jgi:GAF domain-containing protein